MNGYICKGDHSASLDPSSQMGLLLMERIFCPLRVAPFEKGFMYKEIVFFYAGWSPFENKEKRQFRLLYLMRFL